ncbi:MAG: APC family permease [Eubacteriales bacterium]
MSDVVPHELKKHDIKVSTVVFMIFCLCAAGAYGIEEMIPVAGPGLTIVMLIVLPFVWSTPLGLVAAELGSSRPQEGGYYKWVQEACGEFWGFQAGWWRTISIYIDNTLYVILAGGYMATALGLGALPEFFIKAGIIAIFTYINIRGIRDVGIISTILSVLVIAAFGLVAIVGFANWHFNPMIPFIPEGQTLLQSIGYGIAIGLWMYSGYESMSTVAGEVKNPQVIPKATLITVPLIMAVYILPTIGGLGSIGQWESWATDGGISFSDVPTTFLGPAFGLIFVAVSVLAQCSIYNTYIASGSRGFFTLAGDNLAPPILVKVDAKHGVPYVAVLSVAITNLILCNFAFTVIVVVDVFMLMSAYVLIFISAMILRKKIPDSERPFKIPGGDVFMYIICIIPILIAFVSYFINGTDYFIGGMIGILSGPILYVFWKRRYGGLAKNDPIKYPINPKTRLAVGDMKKIAMIFCGIGLMGVIGSIFLPWYEGAGGNDYYLETYGIENMLDLMVAWIKYVAYGAIALSIVLGIYAVKVEPKKITG